MGGFRQFDDLPRPARGIVGFDQRKRAYDAFNQFELVCKKHRKAVWLCFAPFAYMRRTRLAQTLGTLNRLDMINVAARVHEQGQRGIAFEFSNTWRHGRVSLWFSDISLDVRHREKSRAERRDELERIAFIDESEFPSLIWNMGTPDSRLAYRVSLLVKHFGFARTTPHLSLEHDRRTKQWWVVGGVGGDCPIPGTHNANTFEEALEIGEKFVADAKAEP